ncbi:alpha/beta hydrolase [Nonomuraea sp. NPDC001831]|uniref:alpha/beta hydrolase n=1 Tax=Nonomuraea sp. NPDC001831 TaxID=3364340 RepID=UPI0036896C44
MPSAYDLDQVRHANATGRVPVVFVHDPWLLAESWEPWAEVFGQAGFVPVVPAWPEDGEFAGPAAGHFAGLIGGLARRPALVGHAAGGLVAQILAGRGLACACVAISPAPFRGALTYGRFRHAVANAVGEEEARRLYETYAVQAAQAADPWGLDGAAPDRGPLLLVAGELDRTVPWAAAHASYLWQARNRHHLTEIVELPGRGHSMTVDSGWREVCGTALTFIERFVDP